MARRRSMRIRAGLLAVLILAVGATTPVVGAAERCFPDPEGDLLFPEGESGLDLVEFCVDDTPEVITLSIRAVAPFSAADVDQISFELDLAGDRNADAFVNVVRGDDPDATGGLVAVLQTAQGQTADLQVTHDEDRLSVDVPVTEVSGAGWRESEPYDVSVVSQTARTGIDRIPNPWLTVNPAASGGWTPPAVIAALGAGFVAAAAAVFVLWRRRASAGGGEERAHSPGLSDDSDESDETTTVEER